MSAARSKNTFFSTKYRRIRSRRGPMRALVAVEHALIITAWDMLTDGAFYRELGADYYTLRNSESQSPGSPSTPSARLHRHPHTTGPDRITSRHDTARVVFSMRTG